MNPIKLFGISEEDLALLILLDFLLATVEELEAREQANKPNGIALGMSEKDAHSFLLFPPDSVHPLSNGETTWKWYGKALTSNTPTITFKDGIVASYWNIAGVAKLNTTGMNQDG